MDFVYVMIFSLVAGYVLDSLLGDPRWLPHPVVGFGYMIAWVEKCMAVSYNL